MPRPCALFNLFALWLAVQLRDVIAREPITPDGHSQVLAISTQDDTAAIATTDSIYIYDLRPSLPSGSLLGSISLPRAVAKKPGFLELKLLSHHQLFFCDSFSCGFCTLSGNSSSCSNVLISFDGEQSKELRSARATRVHEKIALRIVDNRRRAAVLTLDVQDSGDVKVSQYAIDPPYFEQQLTVFGFSRGKYAYFVGSAYQPYEPTINVNLGGPNLTIPKITRICTLDKTEQLESRMDLALSCGDYGEVSSIGAADYNVDLEQLTISIQYKNDRHTVCRFDLRKIDEQMDKDWNTCQNTSLYDGAKDCESARTADQLKDDHCFIFTRMADGNRMQTCIKFGLNSERRYENCELHQLADKSYRYGWLENFKPIVGQAIASVSKLDHAVTRLVPDRRNNAIFLTADDGNQEMILRIRTSEEALPVGSDPPILWRSHSFPSSNFSIAMAKDADTLYLLNGTMVSTVRVSCPGLYQTCDSLAEGGWQDPLSCVWCPDEHMNLVISSYDKFACTQPLNRICPPTIDHANRDQNHSEWQVFGTNLNRIGDSTVYICGEQCTVNRKLSSDLKLHCFLADGSEQDASCEVRIAGRLQDYDSFSMKAPKVTNSVGVGTEYDMAPSQRSSKSSTKAWKAVVSVIVVVLILLALAVIIWFARKRMMANAAKPEDRSSSRIGFTTTTQMPLPRGNSYTDPEAIRMDQINPSYERLFQEIDPRLKVDVANLRFETQIGKGHFGVVNRATYTADDGETKKVACKMIKEGLAGVREFIEEGTMMARFNHPRIMQLIGIAFTDQRFPIIVTDYMSNGDLVTYLRDRQNSPTLRCLLQFAIQIAEGMEYLHSQNFIHRDLAARNCMLDPTLQVKIADFGLCRECNEENMYEPSVKNRDLPLRWMALEALQTEMYTFQGDVWAYGVVLWELMTRGMIPYGARTGLPLLAYLNEGGRLEMPPYCPLQLYNTIMMPCWDADMEERPTFSQLVILVRSLVSQMENSQHTQLYSHYEKVSSLNSPEDSDIATGSGQPSTSKNID